MKRMSKQQIDIEAERLLCHKWASQSQDYGRANNISFHGNTIYSYGAVIAYLIDEEIVLFNDRSYSRTTSHHQSFIRSAVSHRQIFTVPSFTSSHKENLRAYTDKLRSIADAFWNGRDYWRVKTRFDDYQQTAKEAKQYVKYFGLTLSPLFGLELSGNKAKQKLAQSCTNSSVACRRTRWLLKLNNNGLTVKRSIYGND